MTTRFSQPKDQDGDHMSETAALLKHLEKEAALWEGNGPTGSGEWGVGSHAAGSGWAALPRAGRPGSQSTGVSGGSVLRRGGCRGLARSLKFESHN